MIPSPKIVVVDDDAVALNAIQSSLHRLDTACLPVHVQAGVPKIAHPIKGIKLLFVDIHLLVGGVTGAAVYDVVGQVLERVIDERNGPYVLVTWTTHKDEHEAVLKHLSAHYSRVPPPIASIQLPKEKFMNTHGEFDSAQIATELSDISAQYPQAHALIRWEDAVTRAAGDVVTTLANLVKRETMFLGQAGTKLERLIKAIAQRTVGRENVASDVVTAVNEGFMPLLLDRLSHLSDATGDLTSAWTGAIAEPDKHSDLQAYESAKLNAMYHIAIPNTGVIRVGSRGAVYKVPAGFDFERWFGIKEEALFGEYIQINDGADGAAVKALKSNSEWFLVGVRTACDDAQSKKGSNRVVLALEVPIEQIPAKVGVQKENGPILHCPEYERNDTGRILVLNWLYMLGLTMGNFKDLNLATSFRLRDSMCAYLEHHFSVHASRPGIIDLKKR